MKDRLVGTREAGDDTVCREFIPDINTGESDATTCETLVMRVEEQALVEKNFLDGTPCAVKVARTVWGGGKLGDCIK